MKTNHLSAWQQEEYVINQRTPQMHRHLTECVECRAAVERMEHRLGLFRSAAVEWSAECLAIRPQRLQTRSSSRLSVGALRWAFAALVPFVLLLLALLPLHLAGPRPSHPAAQISDDALLEQVDEQLSVAVPSSMESLTHLVSTESQPGAAASSRGSTHLVQPN
jgi:hypothetical protein